MLNSRPNVGGLAQFFLTDPFAFPLGLPFCRARFILSKAAKVRAIVRTLLTSRTKTISQHMFTTASLQASGMQLTSWNNHPDEVHEEVVSPEV